MNRQKKVAFYTLGCKLNFSETSAIARQFGEGGYQKVEFDDPADVYVINTCSVTDHADKKCRNIVNRARKNSPDAFIAVIGCYAQLKPKEIASIPGVDLVLGAGEKFNIVEHIGRLEKNELSCTSKIHASEIKEVKEFVPTFSYGDRTRSFLKVQDGCDYFCAFCTIPLARGRSRSDSIEKTIREARKIAETNVKEIVLTGVNIGDFGQQNNENFYQLMQELDNLDGIERIRISSIEPNLLSDEIIDFVSVSKKFVPHFHIPLQSGSDKILKLMRRRYDSVLYRNRIEHIKRVMPDCCIGVDVITGFPSESHDDFLETYHFLNELDVSYLHVFTYSERANTTAIRIKEAVPVSERKERSKMLQSLSLKKKRYFYTQQLGKSHTVLFEEAEQDGWINGFTENYIKVKYRYDPELVNTLQKVQLSEIDADGLAIIKLLAPQNIISA